MLKQWKKSGLTKEVFFRQNKDARQWRDLRRNHGADGDEGWCNYKAAGYALWLLNSSSLEVSTLVRNYKDRYIRRHPNLSKPAIEQLQTQIWDGIILQMIEEFTARGIQLNPNRSESKYGANWSEILAFMRNVCSKKIGFGIQLDFAELTRNRYLGGSGIAAIAKCNLESGIYLIAGFNLDRSMGHAVVLEVHDTKM